MDGLAPGVRKMDQEWASHLVLNFTLSVVPVALLYYDYAITIVDEIKLCWPLWHSAGFASVMFFVNRYLLVIGYTPVAISMVLGTYTAGCGAVQTYRQYLQLILQVPIALLSAARVYAFYSQSRRLAIGLGVLMVSLLGMALGLILTLDVNTPLIFFPVAPLCVRGISKKDLAHFVTAWSAVVIFDTVIVALTLYRAVGLWRERGIVHVFLRDGILFFCASLAVNLANILNMIFSPPLLKTALTTFTNILSSVLISRLILNLRIENAKAGVSLTEESSDWAVATSRLPNLDTIISHSRLSRALSVEPRGMSPRHTEDIEMQPIGCPQAPEQTDLEDRAAPMSSGTKGPSTPPE